jgi:hypothetical protein
VAIKREEKKTILDFAVPLSVYGKLPKGFSAKSVKSPLSASYLQSDLALSNAPLHGVS